MPMSSKHDFGKRKTDATKWCAASLLCLLGSLQMLRGLKDMMAIESQLINLPFLISIVFLIMICVSRINYHGKFREDKLLGYGSISLIIILSMVFFGQQFDTIERSSLIYIFISAFSLLLVSQFWKTLMSIFEYRSAKSAYIYIAMAGSIGGVMGPLLTLSIVYISGVPGAFLVAFLLLLISNFAIIKALKLRSFDRKFKKPETFITKSLTNGRNIGLFIFLYAFVATLIYVRQLEIVEEFTSTANQRLVIFSIRDLGIGVLIILYHSYVFRNPSRKINMNLTAFPILAVVTIITINLLPTITVAVLAITLFKTYNFTVVRPARELFYLKFRSIGRYKNFIDSVVYRTGDLAAVWLIFLMNALGWPSKFVLIILIPVTSIWLLISSKIQTQLI